MVEHDSLYHRLFTHPIMVEQLIQEFVPEAMAVGLEFSRMELVSAKFHSQEGKHREEDVIWKLPTSSGTDIYLYLLFGFQSSVDRWMSVRAQVYSGLLWQQIIKERKEEKNRELKWKRNATLPPVLSIVLYNGDRRWTAPLEVRDLIALPTDSPLWPWQPRMRYYLIDEGAFPRDELVRRETLTALLFRLEHCRRPDDLLALIGEVIGWFRLHPGYDALKKLFVEIVAQAAYDIGGEGDIKIPSDLQEVQNMLATRTKEWKRHLIAEGEIRGEVSGETKGKAETLLRQLRRRFGSVSSHIESRVLSADIDQLDEWMDRLMDTRELIEIFGADPTH